MTADASRLRFLAGINTRVLPEATDPGFEFRYIDIGSVGRGHLVAEPEAMVFEGAPSRARRVIRAGDCLVSTVRTYLRAVLPVRAELDGAIASTGFAVLTPGPRLDPRYLGWVAQSDPFIEEIVARSTGVSYPAINALEIGNLTVPTPPIDQQRAVADFLDTETARIDSLCAKKQALTAAIAEWDGVVLNEAMEGDRSMTGPLKRIAIVSPGEGRPDADNVGDVPLIGANGPIGRVSEGNLAAPAVAVGRVGSVGAVNLIQPPAWVSDNALIVRPRPGLADLHYLEMLLRALDLGANAAQTAQPLITQSGVRERSIVIRSLDEQVRIARRIARSEFRSSEIRQRIAAQIHLLAEHRQALITAAVTGELEVPGVPAA